MKIYYVTSNPHKLNKAKNQMSAFDIDIEGVSNISIDEIQSNGIEEISIDKAKKAFQILNKPLIVSDSGWSIPALNDFPGPYMAYIDKWFSSQDFLNLMKEKKDRNIFLQEYVTYINNETVKVFSHKIKGEFLTKIEGEGRSLDKVITFREDRLSVAKCQNDNITAIDQNEMWNELGEYLCSKNRP